MRYLIITIFSIFVLFNYQDKKYNPPGTIELSDNLFIDIAPIDNIMYKEFIYSDHKLNSKQPKTSNNKINFIIKDSTAQYFENPKYSHFPVLKINYQDAVNYCKWRSKIVNQILSKNKKKKIKVNYRLPKTEEFNLAISKFGYSKKTNGRFAVFPIYTYRNNYKKKNKKAIFLKNNLSEYTLDSIPFGTNWKNETNFDSGNDYTGFRCVCEITE